MPVSPVYRAVRKSCDGFSTCCLFAFGIKYGDEHREGNITGLLFLIQTTLMLAKDGAGREKIQHPCGRTRELLSNKCQNTSDTSLKLLSSPPPRPPTFTVSGGNDCFVGIPVTPTSFPFSRNHVCFVLFTTENSGNVQTPPFSLFLKK